MNQIDPHTFLKEYLKTTEVRHSRKTFYEHLCKVEQILKICGCSEQVCLAGLYHSVYGTEYFKKKSTSDREKIKEVIGEEAESLVWIFCNAKRPFCWFFAKNLPLRDGTFIRVNKKQLHALQMIEGANLLEQHSGLTEILIFTAHKEYTADPAVFAPPTDLSDPPF